VEVRGPHGTAGGALGYTGRMLNQPGSTTAHRATSGPIVSGGGGGSRPSVMKLVFREKGALFAAYITALTDGGLFVPTNREYRLGDDIYLLVNLPEDPTHYQVAGKIAWITPFNASGGRTQGVGVRFPADDKSRQLKIKIEEILGTMLASAKPTQTL
jgi:type IV pilus assembly protein PilZ